MWAFSRYTLLTKSYQTQRSLVDLFYRGENSVPLVPEKTQGKLHKLPMYVMAERSTITDDFVRESSKFHDRKMVKHRRTKTNTV